MRESVAGAIQRGGVIEPWLPLLLLLHCNHSQLQRPNGIAAIAAAPSFYKLRPAVK